ncbi:response regulator transcription factor [Aquimarina sp. 2201CG5-10]|uniref:LytR/AlgR family response regulator transcription factor n=1 Tax=Aquimarina callyspongiae TaxID=3098150 RepID=UPI002AB4D14B|nr:response regulator transcription factor [Aquimarina sp. 2201CG5-10]MDY8136162.1 response regulator transcription factor [Aquimarina sp. 2201CG5-10]
MIKYIIVDDETIAHDIIKEYGDLLPNLEFKQHCYDAFEALKYLNEHPVDLMFLDINMPKLKGFELLKTLTHPPKVIVTTAYKEFALEGYELNISDYLLKPFSFERFIKAVNKTIHSIEQSNVSTIVNPSIIVNDSQRIFLKGDKRHIQLAIDTILYLEAYGNYTKVYTQNDTIKTREKISTLMQILPETDFTQVHKSFVVAHKHIHSIEGNRIFIDKYQVPIGKVYKININRLLGN